jgi:acetate kinase
LKRLELPHPDAVGHRLVHAGPDHGAPERITDKLFNELGSLIPFAPLHLPDEIAGIEAVTSNFPSLPQVACFGHCFSPLDAGSRSARRFPAGLTGRRHSPLWIHGIPYEYIMQTLGSLIRPRA